MAATREAVRFMQHERMAADGHRNLNKQKWEDNVNKKKRSFFALHWMDYPRLDILRILPKGKRKKGEHV